MADAAAGAGAAGAATAEAGATGGAAAPSSYAALRAAARKGGQAAARGAQQAGSVVQAEAEVAGAQARDVAVHNAAVAQASYAEARNELGDPALRLASQQAAEAVKARAVAAHAQSVTAAREMQGIAMDAGQRAATQGAIYAEQAGQMAVASADLARQQFEERWNAVLNQEKMLALEAAKLEKFERQLLSLTRNSEPNFPPINCCCFEPVVYHDIPVEVPPERQGFVKASYWNFWCTVVLLIYNFCVALAMNFVSDKPNVTSMDGLDVHAGVAGFELVGVVLAFIIWYWPLYKACSNGTASQHVMCYVGLAVAFIYNAFMTIGFTGYGGCGLLYGLAVKKVKGDDAFYPCLVSALLFGAQDVMFAFMFIRMKCKYGKEDKASLASANAEIARDSVLGGMRV